MAAVRSSLPVKVRYHAWAAMRRGRRTGGRITERSSCAGRRAKKCRLCASWMADWLNILIGRNCPAG
jgi:hypothetical protein